MSSKIASCSHIFILAFLMIPMNSIGGAANIAGTNGSYVMDVMACFLTVLIGPVVVSYLVCHLILCRMSWLV